MKRDSAIIKEILMAIEGDLIEKGASFELTDVDNEILEGHLKLLENEKLILVDDKRTLTGGETLYIDVSLTTKGYDYLETLK